MLVKTPAADKPVRFVLDERLDFNHFVPLRKSYIVAASYRSGSNYLCWELWRTGVLGAPVEFLNPYDALPVLMNRFKASSPSDYVTKLIEHRSSKNGIFGLKTHSHHFETFLKQYPRLLEALAPVTFIHINRRNKLAQAVSMAKALQTDFWTSRIESDRPPAQYDRELIAKCLREVEQQERKWPQWFEARSITPFQVIYEDLIADTPKVVRSIIELLGVANDEPEEVQVPPTRRQGDGINRDWIERFKQESLDGNGHRQAGLAVADGSLQVTGSQRAADEPTSQWKAPHFFDRYERFIDSLPVAPDTATGFVGVIRLRHRYDAIVLRNRDLFRDARILDMMGSDGLWSLAVLDAGAACVVRLAGSQQAEETVAAARHQRAHGARRDHHDGLARDDHDLDGIHQPLRDLAVERRNFEEYGFKPDAYKVVDETALTTFAPGAFDVILCEQKLEETDPRRFFEKLHRLQPRHVILDTEIVRGSGPIARFRLVASHQPVSEVAGRYATIIGSPSHELVMFLCQLFDLQWRRIDWHAMGITDWIGIHDYERDERRTYVLHRVPPPSNVSDQLIPDR